MASFMEMLNAGVGNLTSSPLGQLGTQLLAASGPQQGNPGFGARLGQAVGGMGEMQRVQALQQYRDQMMQQQMQMAMQQQAAEQKAEQQRQYQQRLQSPEFLASLSPMARQMAQLGVDPGELIRAQNADALQQHRQAQLQQQQGQFDSRQARIGAGGGGGSSGPRAPAPRPYIDQPIGNNQMQRFKYDPELQDYAPWGQPFSQYSPGRNAKSADPLEAAIQEMTGGEPTAAGPGLESLPGNEPLAAYAPQAATPLPMAAQGGGLKASTATATSRVPGQPKPATPKTKAEYDALPSGAQYVDPVSNRIATKR